MLQLLFVNIYYEAFQRKCILYIALKIYVIAKIQFYEININFDILYNLKLKESMSFSYVKHTFILEMCCPHQISFY